MRPIVAALAILLAPALAFAQPKAKEPERFVGEVIIVGNTVTQDRVIREVLDLYPGQMLQYPAVRLAERNLKRLGLFKGATVQVLQADGPFKDILVKVEETQTAMFKPVLAVNPRVGFGAAFVLEERNFDPWRLPTTVFDFHEGRAFRGGGQKLQVGIAIGLMGRPQWHVSWAD